MKYTIDGNTVEIPDDFLREAKKKYGLTNKGCIEMYLAGEGLIDKTKEEVVETKSKKKSSRKPDTVKRNLIGFLRNCLEDADVDSVEVINPERIVAFEVGGARYELTLTRKRVTK
jgi:hypothetical protein